MTNRSAAKNRKTGLRLAVAAVAIAIAAGIGWKMSQPEVVPVQVSESVRPQPAETSGLQAGAAPALTEQAAPRQEVVGPYRIEYMALRSTELPAASLTSYGITPNPGTGIITLRIINTEAADPTSPASSVPAQMRVFKRNRSDQLDGVRMQQLSVGGYTSYIGSFAVDDAETVEFQVELTPQNGATHRFSFQQTFYPPTGQR